MVKGGHGRSSPWTRLATARQRSVSRRSTLHAHYDLQTRFTYISKVCLFSIYDDLILLRKIACHPSRTSGHIVVGVCITVIIFNLLEAIQLAYLWNALKWEPETEWDEWRMNGVRVVVGLVCGYLLWTCCAAFVGLLGALKVGFIISLFIMIIAIILFVLTQPLAQTLLSALLPRQHHSRLGLFLHVYNRYRILCIPTVH